jgi:putative ABC transport system substrate-binding protein
MQRRNFVTLLGGIAATWPLAALAQQPAGRVYRVGYLTLASREQSLPVVRVFDEGLRSLGYRVGENVVIEYRFAVGEMEQLPALAADLVRIGVDIILVTFNPITAAAMKATTTIPIVMINSIDPVGTGLIASLARPGGNVTGFSGDTGSEIFGKRLELMKEILPHLSRVGALFNPNVAVNRSRLASMGGTARLVGLTLVPVEARGLDELEQAFVVVAKERAQALVVQGDSVLFNCRGQIAEMALANGLPAVSVVREFADAGLLLAYGANLQDQYRRVASFVDRILKGVKPGDLPVEQPTKFELVVNLKTARALGIDIPPTLLTRADEVIE